MSEDGWRISYENGLQQDTKRERERERKAYGIHIDTKRMNVGDNVSI